MSPRPFYESSLTCIERIQNIAQALLINLRFGHDGSIISPILKLNEAVIDQLTIAKKNFALIEINKTQPNFGKNWISRRCCRAKETQNISELL